MKKFNNKGLTLIEVILSIAILAVIAMMMATVLVSSGRIANSSLLHKDTRETAVGSVDKMVLKSVATDADNNGKTVWTDAGGAVKKQFEGVVVQNSNMDFSAFRAQDVSVDNVDLEPPTVTTTVAPLEEPTTESTTAAVEEEEDPVVDPVDPSNAFQKRWNDLFVFYNESDRDNPYAASTDWATGLKCYRGEKGYYYINNSVILLDDMLFFQDAEVYIDASQNDIDIVLLGSLTVQNGAVIYINDGEGQHQVRIFLANEDDPASQHLTLSGDWGSPGIALMPSGYTPSTCSYNSSVLDYSRPANLYLFGTGEQHINIERVSWFPGYVIAPFSTLKIAKSNAIPPYLKDSPITAGNTPAIYGMAVVGDFDWGGSSNQHYLIKYERPDEAQYEKALSNVLIYND